jgi:uridine phosphorylase
MELAKEKFTDREGRMFFTGLKEGDAAPTVLMPGDLGRSKIIAECWKEHEYVGRRRTFVSYKGKTAGATPISVTSSGMGPMAVSVVLEELRHLGTRNVIRVGTGAALLKNYKPGTIIIATGGVRGEGCSYEYAAPEYPSTADPHVTKALVDACREYGEEPLVGLYRSHDAFYRETRSVMVHTYERMRPWVDAGVKMVENESSAMFVIADLLGLRAGSICVSLWSMIEGTEYYEGPDSRSAYPESTEENFMPRRILLCSKIASRAAELLEERGF